MKKLLAIVGFLGFMACNNSPESTEQKQDTSNSSSADSILKAVEKIKADSAALKGDSTLKKDSIKK